MQARFIVVWLAVALPLLWGVWETLLHAMKLFR